MNPATPVTSHLLGWAFRLSLIRSIFGMIEISGLLLVVPVAEVPYIGAKLELYYMDPAFFR